MVTTMRLIDEVAARERFHNNLAYMGTDVKRILATQPTINLDDLRTRGRWIQHNKENDNWVECSECNTVGSPFWKCCPVCTAMMNSAADNNVGRNTDGKEKS